MVGLERLPDHLRGRYSLLFTLLLICAVLASARVCSRTHALPLVLVEEVHHLQKSSADENRDNMIFLEECERLKAEM